MAKQLGTFILGLFLIIGLSSFDSPSTKISNDWVWLGSKNVTYKLDRDVIHVGVQDGTFKKLKLVVTTGSLNMHKLVVLYGNGSKDEINVRHNFSRASSSRVIDLKGNNRIIKKIMFIYDTKNFSKRRAKIRVYGKR